MDIAVVTPRQLAPSVGNLCAGVTASAAPTSAIYDSPAAGEPICFGSLDFTPHSPASRPAFSSLHEGMDLAFGAFHFHVNTVGALRLPEQIRSAPAEPTSPSAVLAPSSPSSVGSSGEPDFTPTTIFCVDCDAHHVAESEPTPSGITTSTPPITRAATAARTRRVFSVRLINSATEPRTRTVKQPTGPPSTSLRRPGTRQRQALRGSVPMPEDASREDLMAYHNLLHQQQLGWLRHKRNSTNASELADASSVRRAQLSSLHASASQHNAGRPGA